MAFELDHIFILTDVGAAVVDRLVAAGFVEGSGRLHPGQGTANRCFFFHNAMLELLWVHSLEEAQSEPIRRTRLGERWSNRQTVCPFGICWRPVGDAQDIAFASWAYQPPYLPKTVSIAIGMNSAVLTEPMLFQIPFGRRPDQLPVEKAQPMAHPIGLQEITRVTLITPAPHPPSPELQTLIDMRQIQIQAGAAYCLELGFDGETQGKRLDFRPDLPLVVSG
jgi:Glyoxalase-like domain